MITREHKPYKSLISSMIDKLPNINNQWRREFLIEKLILFMSIRGRINFLQLARYRKHKEQRYLQQFEKPYFCTDVSMDPLEVLLFTIVASRSSSFTVMENNIPG